MEPEDPGNKSIQSLDLDSTGDNGQTGLSYFNDHNRLALVQCIKKGVKGISLLKNDNKKKYSPPRIRTAIKNNPCNLSNIVNSSDCQLHLVAILQYFPVIPQSGKYCIILWYRIKCMLRKVFNAKGTHRSSRHPCTEFPGL